MKTLQFTVTINAAPEKVWKSLWDLESYKAWTSKFGEGSYYKTDSFSEGNKIHLLMPSGHGMYSVLDKVDEPRFLALRNVGEIKNFEEKPITDQSWTNAMETYELQPVGEGTKLIVNVDTVEEYIDSMNKSYPIALDKLKELAEE